MIKQGQKFRCFTRRFGEVLRDGSLIMAHQNLNGDDRTGEIAFEGRTFVCAEIQSSEEKGDYIVDITGMWHLREDHFRFEVVK
jgi:hypothetical protein